MEWSAQGRQAPRRLQFRARGGPCRSGDILAPQQTCTDPTPGVPMPVDVLAIAAHCDDVELTCAGTLIRAADAGHRTGILDLTAGEAATRGSAELRAQEAERAAGILGVTHPPNAALP